MNADKPKAIAGLYTVRLTVEGMKHAIEQALIDHDGTLRATIEAELKSVVENFDFKKQVEEVTRQTLRTVVARSIENAVLEAFRNPEVNLRLNSIISEHLTSILKEQRT